MRLWILALALAGCQATAGKPEPAAADASPAPVNLIDVTTVDALRQDLAQAEEPAVVLNVWATWCAPCIAEFPMIAAFGRETDGVAVRFVSVDDPADREAVVAFVANQGVTDPTYLYTGRADLPTQINPAMMGGAIPVTFVLDGEGQTLATHLGAISRQELEALVAGARS